MSIFTVALVGKPNVGKSTLFNLLAGKNLAIVQDTPGVTIDYKERVVTKLASTPVNLVDTGGIINFKQKNDLLNQAIKEQSLYVIKKADLVLFIVDAKQGLTLEDKEIAATLRKLSTNVVLVINKIDVKMSQFNLPEFSVLGFKNVVEISATHNRGLEQLRDIVQQNLLLISNQENDNLSLSTSNTPLLTPESDQATTATSPFLSIAIVGKSNVGKSTLINALLKEKRMVVSDIAGTTRDAISTYFNYKNNLVRLIDTAGLKRKSKTTNILEKLSTSDTIRSIIFAQIVIIVIDASVGFTKQDLMLASYICKEGRGLIIAINKIDLIADSKKFIKNITEEIEHEFNDIKKVKVIAFSALHAKGITKIFSESLKVYKKWSIIIKTSLLNRWLATAIAHKPPELYKRRVVKLKFMAQSKTRPPSFNLWVNIEDSLSNQYINYLRNKMYRDFNLWGVPLRFTVKTSKNPYKRTSDIKK